MSNNAIIDIAFVCDRGYLMQTSVAVHTLLEHLSPSMGCRISVVVPRSSDCPDVRNWQRRITSILNDEQNRSLDIIFADETFLSDLHEDDPDSICVATPAALLKFKLAELLPNCDKVLYLDGDIVVKGDLAPLWDIDLGTYLVAAVQDSGSIYWKHEYVQRVHLYFNSGVMLLNLKAMRSEGIAQRLIAAKKSSQDTMLMDQNVFNVVFDERVKPLPIKWNCLFVNLMRAQDNYSIDEINETYETEYSSLSQVASDAAIIHYSSKDKPWISQDAPLSELWFAEYLLAKKVGYLYGGDGSDTNVNSVDNTPCPKVSVIIPVYNTGQYLEASLDSVVNQSLRDIEIVCVDDGSTDESWSILQKYASSDARFTIIHQENHGQSAARNKALRVASGEYIYFFDSDDLLDVSALRCLYDKANAEGSDIVFFDGETVFASAQLAQTFSSFAGIYTRHHDYDSPASGEYVFTETSRNNEYLVSPCLMFFKRSFLKINCLSFVEGIVHEDNIFAANALIKASTVSRMNRVLFYRRVREGSTMTSRSTEKDYASFFTCSVMLYKLSEESRFLLPETRSVLTSKARSFLNKAQTLFFKLDKKKQYCPAFLDEEAHLIASLLFNLVSNGFANRSVTQQQLKREFEKGMAKTKESNSWKIGRAFTFVPRKLKKLIR